MPKKYMAVIVGAAVLFGAHAYADPDAPQRYRWSSEEANAGTGSFSAASGLALETPAIEYRNGQQPSHTSKINGLSKYGNTHFKRSGEMEPIEQAYFFEYVKEPGEHVVPHRYTPAWVR